MMHANVSSWSRLGLLLMAVLFAGCLRSGTSTDLNSPDYPFSVGAGQDHADSLLAVELDSTEAEIVVDSLTEPGDDLVQELHRLFAEAEQYYAQGVVANQNAFWVEAQYDFEKATEILANIDLANVEQSDIADQFDVLLREIAADYQFTLTSMGGLSSESSMAAFLLRFESLANLQEYQETQPVETSEKKQTQVAYDIPLELNGEVKSCVVYFQTVARKPFEIFLKRSGRYIPQMKEIIARYDLPSDLVYLPLIESGFNCGAYSYAHASGPWQFIASTGQRYGMDRSWWRDERRDFVKSTHAACKYLKYLYEMFRSWPLALAAYNGGEGRVARQIARQGTDDFWKLRLKKQTRDYVPLFMAAVMIAKEPERFGFGGIDYDEPLEYDVVQTSKPLELKALAKHLECSHDELQALNPELLRSVTPPGEKEYTLRVPKGYGEKFTATYSELPESNRAKWSQHRVRRGETLSSIARSYAITQEALVDANKLGSRHRIYVGQMLTIPVSPNYASSAADKPTKTAKATKSTTGSRRTVSAEGKYFVRRGETLWDIARAFSTTASALRKANGMRPGDKLPAGQWIKIPGRENPVLGKELYTVRAGDTIWDIAGHFGVKVEDLLAANNVKDPRRINTGTVLRIPQ